MAKHMTYRGVTIDMDMLKFQNQHQVALGNGKMNARGDIIGKGGTVIKTVEDRQAEKEREMQVPDFIPEHQMHSTEIAVDDGFDDNMFEVPAEPEEVEVEKRAPRRAKTKDNDQE